MYAAPNGVDAHRRMRLKGPTDDEHVGPGVIEHYPIIVKRTRRVPVLSAPFRDRGGGVSTIGQRHDAQRGHGFHFAQHRSVVPPRPDHRHLFDSHAYAASPRLIHVFRRRNAIVCG